MPPATEQIKDKAQFNVYAMLLILCFVFTGGAALMLNDELDKTWNFWEEKGKILKAVNITKMNDDPGKYPDVFMVTPTDLKEWSYCSEPGATFTVKDYQYPDGYNALENPVKANTDNLLMIPEQLDKLKAAYKGTVATAPAETTPDAPKIPAEPIVTQPPVLAEPADK